MPPRSVSLAAALGAALLFAPAYTLGAQNDRDNGTSLDLGINGVGLSIGDSRRWNGLRINYRDSHLV